MLADLQGADGAIFESPFDVCISGSGPAGMTLALQLASRGHRILLLEAGGLQFSEESQDIYRGANKGLDYFPSDICRLRFFGGTSNHWSGWCEAMSADDFTVHDHIPYSGWPIRKADLDSYLGEAVEILDVQFRRAPDYLFLNDGDSHLRKIGFGYSNPVTRFGTKYRQAIASARNLVAVVNANVTDIELDENLGSVSSLRVANYVGNTFHAKARYYVLCHGAIENARTLLSANRQITSGIGNGKDLVGRFFMEHPHANVASVIVNEEHPQFAPQLRAHDPNFDTAFYEPTRTFRYNTRVLNFGLRVTPGLRNIRLSRSFRQRLRNVVCASDTLLPIADLIARDGQVDCSTDMRLKTAAEQAPNLASRITLGKDVDRFGNRRVEVDWRLTELDKHTFRQSALELGRVMARKNLGRVRLSEWLREPGFSFPDTRQDEVGGKHHMGTTRMAESPDRGVVDKYHRVFGIDNLHIGGASVFATSGHVNPTLTIVQLSLRLADHLHARLLAG